MAGPLHDVRSTPAIDQFYDSLDESDQRTVGHLITLLRIDPFVDEAAGKVPYGPGGCDTLIAYIDGHWAIVYSVVDREIRLLLIADNRPGRYRLSGL